MDLDSRYGTSQNYTVGNPLRQAAVFQKEATGSGMLPILKAY